MGESNDNGESEDAISNLSASDADSASVIGLVGVVSSHRERKEQIVQQISDPDDIGVDLKDDIRFFFLWGHAVIEYYSAHLIRTYLINDRFDKETWDYFIGESRPSISQSHREELLKQSGIFNGIEDKIGNIRYFRNKFAHSPFKPIRWEEDDVEREMEKLIDIIDSLYAALNNEEVKDEIRAGSGLE